MNVIKKSTCTFTLILSFGISAALCQTGYKVLKNHKIGSSGLWDYITIDSAAKRMYVSHGNQVNVLSTSNGDSVGVVLNTLGVHGIVINTALSKGYTSNGMANSISIFDLKTLKVLKEVPVGQNPDAIFYDDFSEKIITCNGNSNDLSVFDPLTEKVIATIPLGDKPETAVSDGKGKIFVNGEETSTLFVIDAKEFKKMHAYKINGGTAPSGLDIDRSTNRLFIGCGDSKTMVIMNPDNGKTIAKFPIGSSDGVVFDQNLKIAFASNGEGTISVVKELSANKFIALKSIVTETGARTIALDKTTHHLFLPAAKTKPSTTGGWPIMIPGTFHVIEVGPSN
ncbi:MAG: YncE family protein [Flavobacterium sp.]|nr:YncE family protein [Pedobacter sp.]